MATDSAAMAMVPLDEVFMLHSVATNHALARYPRQSSGGCSEPGQIGKR